jgi:hypothetical protein
MPWWIRRVERPIVDGFKVLFFFVVTQFPRHENTPAQVLVLIEDTLDVNFVSPTGERSMTVRCSNLLQVVLTLVFVKSAQQLDC